MGVLESIHNEGRYCHRSLPCSRLRALLLQEGIVDPPCQRWRQDCGRHRCLPWRVPPPDHAHPRSRWFPDVRRLHCGLQTRSSPLDTAVTACPLPSSELRWAATTCTRTIRTSNPSPWPRSGSTRTTTASTSTTTSACSLLMEPSAWEPTLAPSAPPTAWRSTTRARSAP